MFFSFSLSPRICFVSRNVCIHRASAGGRAWRQHRCVDDLQQCDCSASRRSRSFGTRWQTARASSRHIKALHQALREPLHRVLHRALHQALHRQGLPHCCHSSIPANSRNSFLTKKRKKVKSSARWCEVVRRNQNISEPVSEPSTHSHCFVFFRLSISFPCFGFERRHMAPLNFLRHHFYHSDRTQRWRHNQPKEHSAGPGFNDGIPGTALQRP